MSKALVLRSEALVLMSEALGLRSESLGLTTDPLVLRSVLVEVTLRCRTLLVTTTLSQTHGKKGGRGVGLLLERSLGV